MKVRLLLTLALLASVSAGTMAQDFKVAKAPFKAQAPAAVQENEYTIRYCGDDIYCLGTGMNIRVRASIKVSAEEAAVLEGTNLTKVGFALGAIEEYPTTGMSDFHVFVSSRPDGGDIVTYDMTDEEVTEGGWYEITLATPYEITGDEFYIGYEADMVAEAYSIGMNPYEGRSDNSYLYGYNQGRWQSFVWQSSYGGLDIYGIAVGDVEINETNLMLKSGSIDSYIESGSKVPVSFVLCNYSFKPVTGYNFEVGPEGETTTMSYDGTLNPGEQIGLTAEYQFGEVEGLNNISFAITASAADGNSDITPEDNTITMQTNLYNRDATLDEPRSILLEQFTTEVCPNCPYGHQVIDAVLEQYDEPVIRVAHHAGYYTDKYTLEYSEAICNFFFNAGYTFAPSVMFGRKHYPEMPDSYSGTAPGPIFGVSQSTVTEAMNDQITIPTFISMNIDTEFDQATNKLKIRVYGESLLAGMEKYINVFITEDGITTRGQSGATGQWTHNHVLRDVLTAPEGDVLQFGEDGSYTYETEWTVKSQIVGDYGTTSVNPENINVVAFIADMDVANPLKCEVYNAVNAEKVLSTGINDAAEVDGVYVYANGSEIVIDGAFDGASVYTVDGVLVETVGAGEGVTSVQGLNAGIYIVKVAAGDSAKSVKVVVD